MADILTRAEKGAKLTIQEMDTNLTNLNTQGINNTAELATKVTQEIGKQLTEENFTAVDKAKLVNIKEYFLGSYISLVALQAAHPTAHEGEEAIVDTVGADAIRYIWDSTDGKWVEGGKGLVVSVNGKVGTVTLSTDDIPEGTKKYSTISLVLNYVLSGFSSATGNNPISASDTILNAFNKISGSITDIYTSLSNKVPTSRTIASKPLTTNIVLDKNDVNLGNVNNTSDLDKPISTETQTALDSKASKDAGSLTVGTLDDDRLSENIPIKENGLIKIADLPEAELSKLQFETLPDGTIGIKTSYLESLGLGGLPTPTAPTVTVSGRNVLAIHPSYPNGLEYSINNGTFSAYVDSTPINVGLGEVLSNYYRFRVKAVAGVNNTGLVAGNPYIASEDGSYVVENTYISNFSSEYTSAAPSPPYNTLQPPSDNITVDNGYTSSGLKNTSAVLSTITVGVLGAFSGQSGQISGAQDALGDIGIFPNIVVNTGWTLNGGTSAQLLISSLNPSKFYQVYFLMPTDDPSSVRGVTVGGVTKNKTATTVLGSFGQAANGLNDPEWIVFNNLTGSSFIAAINRVSGDYGSSLACMVIEESNIAKS